MFEDTIRFQGKVAIITGAGRGLGRLYAIALAKRGASVIINDPGVATDGTGEDGAPAAQVVEEIRAFGGQAEASFSTVATPEGGKEIVDKAISSFGRVDIVVHNAGILRDKSFHKMTSEQWEAVRSVHLDGAFHVCQPAFVHMKQQGFGRIVFASSGSGLFGNFGQANYSAAKMGLVGLMNTLQIEGASSNICVNTIAPLASSRMTEALFPPDFHQTFQAEHIAPFVVGLCAEEQTSSGGIYHIAGGKVQRVAIVANHGVRLMHPEASNLRDHWEEMIEKEHSQEYDSAGSAIAGIYPNAIYHGEKARREEPISLRDKVIIITGAGGGLGKIFAKGLAACGAKVVANDPGVAMDGSGGSTSPADVVAQEIMEQGGEAIANYDSIATSEGGSNLVQQVIQTYGRVDVVIHCAGILRDKSFHKMTPAAWNMVRSVHLDGAYHVCQPAFAHMKQQGFGRMIFMSSAAGLFGNFGQANYSAAKMGLVGLMNTLKIEGAAFDFQVNTVAPVAKSRMTEHIFPPEMLDMFSPEHVFPLVANLCSEDSPSQGGVYQAAMGCFNQCRLLASKAFTIPTQQDIYTVEDVLSSWQEITSLPCEHEVHSLPEIIPFYF